MKYYKLKVLKDNYIWFLITNKVTLAIDCGCSKDLLTFINKNGFSLDYILITHSHSDHIHGLVDVIQQTKAKIICGPLTKNFLPPVVKDRVIVCQSSFRLGEIEIIPIATPGHSEDHTCFYFPQPQWLFSGDTLFTLGCGRAFFSIKLLYESIQKIINMCAQNSWLFPGHNYIKSNLNFLKSINYFEYKDKKLMELNLSDPTPLNLELQYNPFLNINNPNFKRFLAKESLTAYEFFVYLRELKDKFSS